MAKKKVIPPSIVGTYPEPTPAMITIEHLVKNLIAGCLYSKTYWREDEIALKQAQETLRLKVKNLQNQYYTYRQIQLRPHNSMVE